MKTGLGIAIPPDTYARVAPRSGLAVKHGIATGAGVVDEDYRGEVGVVLFNHGKQDFAGAARCTHAGPCATQTASCELCAHAQDGQCRSVLDQRCIVSKWKAPWTRTTTARLAWCCSTTASRTLQVRAQTSSASLRALYGVSDDAARLCLHNNPAQRCTGAKLSKPGNRAPAAKWAFVLFDRGKQGFSGAYLTLLCTRCRHHCCAYAEARTRSCSSLAALGHAADAR